MYNIVKIPNNGPPEWDSKFFFRSGETRKNNPLIIIHLSPAKFLLSLDKDE